MEKRVHILICNPYLVLCILIVIELLYFMFIMKHAFSFLYRSEVEMEKKRDSFFLPNKKNHGNKGNKELKQNNDSHNKRQKQFDEKRDVSEKKPFDKKTYRLKKYSKKYKLDQWEEHRKKKLLHEYYKDTKKDAGQGSYKVKSFDEDNTDSPDGIGRFVRHPDIIENEQKNLKAKKDPYFKAKEKFEKIKQEKIEKKQELEKTKEERKVKLQEYKKKKQDRFKKLSKKNKKGQPMMTGRLELLLEKIQKGAK